MKGPCMKCASRRYDCHCNCEKYKAWKEELKIIKACAPSFEVHMWTYTKVDMMNRRLKDKTKRYRH